MVTKACTIKSGASVEKFIRHNWYLMKKGVFQKSANFSGPTNHAQVLEPLGS